MKFTYYIVQDRSLDKDKMPESIIAKYNGTAFLAAIPLPRFAKIDDSLFNKAPRIPKKNVEYVLTKQDLNKDGVKDIVISVFHKGKYIVSVPFHASLVFKKNKGTQSIGGQASPSEMSQNNNLSQDNVMIDGNEIKYQTKFEEAFKDELKLNVSLFGIGYLLSQAFGN